MSALSFHELQFGPHSVAGGIRARVKYPNGYQASVVKFNGSYGFKQGLYEMAVLDDDGLCYDTPITDDVLRNLTEDDVTETLKAIAALPAKAGAA
ncbi:MAG: hypothetical protein V4657_03875 [Pseudomonadota bacterium]